MDGARRTDAAAEPRLPRPGPRGGSSPAAAAHIAEPPRESPPSRRGPSAGSPVARRLGRGPSLGAMLSAPGPLIAPLVSRVPAPAPTASRGAAGRGGEAPAGCRGGYRRPAPTCPLPRAAPSSAGRWGPVRVRAAGSCPPRPALFTQSLPLYKRCAPWFISGPVCFSFSVSSAR